MLSILSSLAENEFVSLSENSKWSIRQRFKRGTYKLSYPPYGNDDIDEQVIVNEEQAQVVKRIFKSVLVMNRQQVMKYKLNITRHTFKLIQSGNSRAFMQTMESQERTRKYKSSLIK